MFIVLNRYYVQGLVMLLLITIVQEGVAMRLIWN